MVKNLPATQETWVQSQVVLVVKNPPTKAGDIRDSGSIPGPGRSPGERKIMTDLEFSWMGD